MTAKVKTLKQDDQITDLTSRLVDMVDVIMESQHGIVDEDGDSITIALISHLLIELGGFLQLSSAIECGHDPHEEIEAITLFALQALEQGMNRNLCPDHQVNIEASLRGANKRELH